MKLNEVVIFGEGENDAFFLHEVITSRLKIDPSTVKLYLDFRSFELDIWNMDQKPISILLGGGSGTSQRVVKYSRKFWYEPSATQSIGVIGDLDTGSIYAKVVHLSREYLNTKCKQHNIHPKLSSSNLKKELKIAVNGETIIIWAHEVPCSLEIQISRALKRNYPRVRSTKNEDEVIRATARLLKISKEEVIRRSVSMVAQEAWFQELEKKLSDKLYAFLGS
jgi:hypothetical protein